MESEINKAIKSVLEGEKMADGIVTIKNANVEITDGLMSEIYRVNVAKKDSNGKQELNLIVKLSPTDPQYQNIVKVLYASEIHFYDKIVPAFDQIQVEYTQKPFNFIPKYHGVVKDGDQEIIVMDDLSAKGYKMLDTKYVFTDIYFVTVLRELAKFHALSFAVQKEDADFWKKLDFPVEQADIYTGETVQWFKDSLKKMYEMFGGDSCVRNKLKALHDNFENEIKNLLTPSEKYPSVIVHMDPWCNNFMFKHDENKAIEDVALIDFQTATKGSPVLDVSCFLYINASTGALKNWQEMLRVYYDCLCTQGRALNCSVEDVYSWEMFMDDWKDYAKYGLVKATMGSFNPQELEDDKAPDTNVIGADFFVEKLEFKTMDRLKGLLCHAAEHNFL